MASGVELATAYVSLTVEASKIAPETAKQFGAVEKQADATGKRAGTKMGSGVKSGLGGMLKGVGGLFAGVFALKGIKDFVSSSISAASDLQQSVGGVEAVFGKQAEGIKASAIGAAQGLGLSTNAYQELAATLGSGLKNKGIKDFSSQTQNLIGIGADLSAQFGGSTKEAVDALASAMRGESDPIERYGVSLNQTAIQAEAMRLGLVKGAVDTGKVTAAQLRAEVAQRKYNAAVKEHGKNSTQAKSAQASLTSSQAALKKALAGTKGELSDTNKAQAALSLITRQTKDAQGAFGRESDTAAGKQQRLNASLTNLKASIGEKLLPAVTNITGKLNEFVNGMQDGTGSGGKFRDIIERVGSILVSTGKFLLDHKGIVKTVVAAWVAWRLAAIIFNVTQMASLAILKAHTVGTVENTVVTKAAAVASKLFAAGQWLVNAALSANPIGIVIALIVLLVAGIIIAYKKSETFRKIVAGAFDAISAAARFMWNNVVAPVIRFLLDAFVKVTSFYATLLRGLSKIPGFGWAKGAADKLQAVANKAAGIKDAIHDIPSKKDVSVNFHVTGGGKVNLGKGVSVDVGQYRARAMGGPVSAGTPYIVGEHEAELFVPKTSGMIYNQRQLAQMGGPGSGKTDLSDATLYRLAGILQSTPMHTTISAGTVQRAAVEGLR